MKSKSAFSDSKLRSSSSPLCVQREASKRIFPLPLCDRATRTPRRTRCLPLRTLSFLTRLKGAEALPLGPGGKPTAGGVCACTRLELRDICMGGGGRKRAALDTRAHQKERFYARRCALAWRAGALRLWLHRSRWMFPTAWMKRRVAPPPLQTTRTARDARFASALG